MRSGERVDRDHPLLTSALTLLASADAPASTPSCPETGEIARARRDPAAFAPLYERYIDAVHGYCLRRVSDREQAADLTAQIFTRALAAMPAYVESGSGTFRSWLFSIAHNLLVDTYRQRRETVSIERKALGGILADRAPGPEDHALHGDLRRAFREALGELTDGQREVVELRLAGLTGPEIATVLGMTLAAVKSVQFRAYTRLRELLAPQYGPEETTP